MSLSGVYGTSDDDDGIALIHQALDAGLTLKASGRRVRSPPFA
jgi:hypothetical protein